MRAPRIKVPRHAVSGRNGRLILCFLLGLWLVTSWSVTSHAAQMDDPATSVYAFGLHLFRLGEYYRAITELKRFSLLFPQHQQLPAAQVLIGLALQEDGEPNAALAHFQRMHATYETTNVGRLAAFKLGELHFVQQQYPQAIEQFQRFLHTFPDGPLVDRSLYLLGLSWALEGHPERAQQTLAVFPAEHVWSERVLALQHELQTTALPTPKSPRVAGILAGILPGAGHLYLGKPRHALTAFLLNGLFLTGAVYAILEGLEATAAILLFFETGWYLGNINSAVSGAREINLQQQEVRRQHLQATYGLPHLTLERLQMPGIGLRLRF
jgi:outer membrane protein assembly factor BamD (BamD/ComL family)